ncbi:uncharacterized protein LOC129966971 [Argiope bruennichi]|uniref:uncharacterized protein LOC129966971 n=1 Tax=Argiope bruennichi TaxID=94029 RepID=UPI002495684A|nr:uncharacterized protein LOC129966971 [Argiope bruennichi]
MKTASALLIVGSILLVFFDMSRHQSAASAEDAQPYDEKQSVEFHKKLLSCIACTKDDEARTDYISCTMLMPDSCREWMQQCSGRYVKKWDEPNDFFTQLCGKETAIENVIECSRPPNEHCNATEGHREEEKQIIEKYRACVMDVMKNHCEL